MLMVMASCDDHVVYSDYRHVDMNGWYRDDTLKMTIADVQEDGHYKMNVNVRTANSIALKTLAVRLNTRITPLGKQECDTVYCNLFDDEGVRTGDGVAYAESSHSARPLYLHRGDTLEVSINHVMRSMYVSSVTEIGITLERY